jgi:hypothetical protein
VSGSEPDLGATVAQHVERRDLACDERGMTEVVVEHEHAEPQRRRHRRGSGERRDRRVHRVEMVGGHERVEPERLSFACEIEPLGARPGAHGLKAEPERARRHGRSLAHRSACATLVA